MAKTILLFRRHNLLLSNIQQPEKKSYPNRILRQILQLMFIITPKQNLRTQQEQN